MPRNNKKLAVAALAVFPCMAMSACAEENAHWTATSTTSISITGDIVVSDDTLSFAHGPTIRIEPEGKPADGDGRLYRLEPPADPVLLNGNQLCGGVRPVSYIVMTKPSEDSLSMAVFDSIKAPDGENDNPCAIYNYER